MPRESSTTMTRTLLTSAFIIESLQPEQQQQQQSFNSSFRHNLSNPVAECHIILDDGVRFDSVGLPTSGLRKIGCWLLGVLIGSSKIKS